MRRTIYFLFLLVILFFDVTAQNTNPWPSSGNVGIGTTTPLAELHVKSTVQYPRYYVQSTSSTGAPGYGITETNGNGAWTWHYDISGGFMGFHRNGLGNTLVISNTGKVGIGTFSPTYNLEVSGAGNITHRVESTTDGYANLYLKGNGKTWAIGKNPSSQLDHLQFYYNDGAWSSAYLTITRQGNIAIGTDDPKGYRFAVNGDAIFTKIKVKPFANWPDYVFHPSYRLRPLAEVEEYIQQYQHLPEVPSAAEVEKNGLDLGENQAVLLKKIEELTLYLLDHQKTMQEQQKQIEELRKEIAELKKRR